MNHQDSQYAHLNGTTQIKHIDDVNNGKKCDCVCLTCGKPLVAKHGKIQKHHFSHSVNDNCLGGTETLLHLMTKEVISEMGEMHIPKTHFKSTVLSNHFFHIENPEVKKETFGYPMKLKNIILEKKDGNITPDIKATIIHNNKKHEIIIEVAVTHFIDEKKEQHLKEHQKNCIEINLSHLVEEIIDLDLKQIKEKIRKSLKNPNLDSHPYKWIAEFITKDDQKLLDHKLEKNIKFVNNYILENIKNGFKIQYEFEQLEVTEKRGNCFGTYIRKNKRKPIKNMNYFEIINIKSKDHKTMSIDATVSYGFLQKNVRIFINQFPEEIKDNEIFVNFDNYDFVIEKEEKITIFKNHVYLLEHKFYDKEKIIDSMKKHISKKEDSKNYKNFLTNLIGRTITLPNPCFENEKVFIQDNLGNFYQEIVPKNMMKNKITIKIYKVEIEDKKNPNIIKIFHSEKDFLYIIFHRDVNIVKELNVCKTKYKNKTSILYFWFAGDGGMINLKNNNDWSNFGHEWIYHSGFEKLKVNLINKTNLKFNVGCAIFMKRYSYLLK